MEIKENLTNINYTKMTNKVNKYIVIHYVGAVSSAYNNSVYFKNVNRNTSAHYFVDEDEIYRVVKDSDKAWHCGDKLKIGQGGKFNGLCTNSNSISIEMCCVDNNGTLDFLEKTIVNTVELVKELMAKYNIPAENVIRHYDVTNKNCPAPFVQDESRWIDFKNKLSDSAETSQNNTIEQVSSEGNKNKNTGIVATIQSTLNEKYNLSIDVDNKFGKETKKALIIGLQTELNKQFNKELKVDGIFGIKTKNACVSVRKGAKGNITWILQAILICKGYNIALDGDFGINTENAVKDYQSKKCFNCRRNCRQKHFCKTI